MAHRTRIRANLAAWANASAVLNTEYDAFDAAQFAAVDGDAGGIWLPASKIMIGGAGVDLTGQTDIHGASRIVGVSSFNASLQAQNWPERSSSAAGGGFKITTAFAPGLGFNGGPLYCAITEAAIAYTSDDGSKWVNQGAVSTSTTNPHAAFGNYNAVPSLLINSSSGFYSSPDGATWTFRSGGGTPNGAYVYASGLGLWVSAGDAGVVSTSPDGITWTARTTPAGWISGSGGAKRIVWNGSLFVVLPLGSYTNVLTSPDGVTWTERTIVGVAKTWTGLRYGTADALWMAVSTIGVISTSTDGITWTSATPGSFPGATDLAVNNVLWVATTSGGANGGLVWSVDKGVTWQTVAVGDHRANAGYKRVMFADGRFLIAKLNAGGTGIDFALSLRSS